MQQMVGVVLMERFLAHAALVRFRREPDRRQRPAGSTVTFTFFMIGWSLCVL